LSVVDVADAIADPIRRRIMTLLNERTMSAGEIAACFDISRPAVSRHLRVLRSCGLAVDEVRGRERLYHLDVAPLTLIASWLDQFLPGWPNRLDALETEVYRTRRDRRTSVPALKEDTA
jgi:DNA-binding transcriptional ArsR family regulator